ncbi:MAG: flagellar hook-basal body complex protein [Verrucomicrobium sp.]|nr:flagellar hook-basal body complex protein [Verrucomicrobium sp.]
MIRALYSAVSGLTSDQTAMDVIGNNVANLNTTGFKASTAEFSEAYYQTSRLADSSTPIGLSVGLGTKIAGTVTDFTQGSIAQTGIPSDVAISGNGYFVVNTQSTTAASNTYYTRAGDFVVDVNGNLRTVDGYYVQGYSAGTSTQDATETTGFQSVVQSDFAATDSGSAAIDQTSMSNIVIPSTISSLDASGNTVTEQVVSYSVGNNGAISVIGQNGTSVVVGYLPIALVSANNGLNSVGGGYYQATEASGVPTVYEASTNQTGSLQGSALELSNADVATQFSNMIIIQNSYAANAKVISTSSQMLQVVTNMVQ